MPPNYFSRFPNSQLLPLQPGFRERVLSTSRGLSPPSRGAAAERQARGSDWRLLGGNLPELSAAHVELIYLVAFGALGQRPQPRSQSGLDSEKAVGAP